MKKKMEIKKKIEVDFVDLLRIIFYLGVFLACNFLACFSKGSCSKHEFSSGFSNTISLFSNFSTLFPILSFLPFGSLLTLKKSNFSK